MYLEKLLIDTIVKPHGGNNAKTRNGIDRSNAYVWSIINLQQ